jgi:hypothetical protein
MQSKGIVFSDKKYKVPFFNYQLSEKVEYGKIRILLGEEIDGKFKRACIAEFIAMLFFVIMCCGCAMATLAIPNPNLMGVFTLFLIFAMIMIIIIIPH